MCPVPGAGLREQRWQGSAKAQLEPPVPSTPLTPAPADQPEMGAAALGSMNVLESHF